MSSQLEIHAIHSRAFTTHKHDLGSFRAVGIAVALLITLLATGCGSKISQSNYDKVQDGMTQAEVEGILGLGKEQGSSSVNMPGMSVGGTSVSGMSMSVKNLMWQDGTKTIAVTFQDGKVMAKVQSGL